MSRREGSKLSLTKTRQERLLSSSPVKKMSGNMSSSSSCHSNDNSTVLPTSTAAATTTASFSNIDPNIAVPTNHSNSKDPISAPKKENTEHEQVWTSASSSAAAAVVVKGNQGYDCTSLPVVVNKMSPVKKSIFNASSSSSSTGSEADVENDTRPIAPSTQQQDFVGGSSITPVEKEEQQARMETAVDQEGEEDTVVNSNNSDVNDEKGCHQQSTPKSSVSPKIDNIHGTRRIETLDEIEEIYNPPPPHKQDGKEEEETNTMQSSVADDALEFLTPPFDTTASSSSQVVDIINHDDGSGGGVAMNTDKEQKNDGAPFKEKEVDDDNDNGKEEVVEDDESFVTAFTSNHVDNHLNHNHSHSVNDETGNDAVVQSIVEETDDDDDSNDKNKDMDLEEDTSNLNKGHDGYDGFLLTQPFSNQYPNPSSSSSSASIDGRNDSLTNDNNIHDMEINPSLSNDNHQHQEQSSSSEEEEDETHNHQTAEEAQDERAKQFQESRKRRLERKDARMKQLGFFNTPSTTKKTKAPRIKKRRIRRGMLHRRYMLSSLNDDPPIRNDNVEHVGEAQTLHSNMKHKIKSKYPHRDTQIDLLYNLFHSYSCATASAATSSSNENEEKEAFVPPPMFLTGNGGCGKTSVLDEVLTGLTSVIDQQNHHHCVDEANHKHHHGPNTKSINKNKNVNLIKTYIDCNLLCNESGTSNQAASDLGLIWSDILNEIHRMVDLKNRADHVSSSFDDFRVDVLLADSKEESGVKKEDEDEDEDDILMESQPKVQTLNSLEHNNDDDNNNRSLSPLIVSKTHEEENQPTTITTAATTHDHYHEPQHVEDEDHHYDEDAIESERTRRDPVDIATTAAISRQPPPSKRLRRSSRADAEFHHSHRNDGTNQATTHTTTTTAQSTTQSSTNSSNKHTTTNTGSSSNYKRPPPPNKILARWNTGISMGFARALLPICGNNQQHPPSSSCTTSSTTTNATTTNSIVLILDHGDRLLSVSSSQNSCDTSLLGHKSGGSHQSQQQHHHRPNNMLGQLLLLPRLYGLNICVVVVTTNSLLGHTRVHNTHEPTEFIGTIQDLIHPIHVRFDAYRGKDVFYKILTQHHVKHQILPYTNRHKVHDDDDDDDIYQRAYKSMLNILLPSIHYYTRDIREMIRLCRLLWPKIHDLLTQKMRNTNSTMLPRNVENIVLNHAKSYISELITECLFQPSKTLSPTPTTNHNNTNRSIGLLPTHSKFILIAAYLCQSHDSKNDANLYTNQRKGQRRKKQQTRKASSHEEDNDAATSQQQQKGFPMERMLSVFTSIVSQYAILSEEEGTLNHNSSSSNHNSNKHFRVSKLGTNMFFAALAQLRDLGLIRLISNNGVPVDVQRETMGKAHTGTTNGGSSSSPKNSLKGVVTHYKRSSTLSSLASLDWISMDSSEKYVCRLGSEEAERIASSVGFPLFDYLGSASAG